MGQKSSDRLRTIWMPEMDRYFIDLMLDQVEKGNRIDDHLFSKRAWKHMTMLFNTKFKFHYEKDVLKNRHKTLRNLYKAINKLLALNGFSWDHTRHMVTADNQVWDDYIKLIYCSWRLEKAKFFKEVSNLKSSKFQKDLCEVSCIQLQEFGYKVNPNARSFRIKSIPYYSDLCQIYKNIPREGDSKTCEKNAMKSLSESIDDDNVENNNADLEALHEIIIDEDFRVSISKEFDDAIDLPQSDEDIRGTRVRTHWQPPMDRYFIDLMVDQVKKGNQIDGLFRKQAWIEMIKSFNARFGFKYDVDILKNRYKTFKRQYNVINNLLESQGFYWDDLRQMVIADDRSWQDYIEVNSDARQYMTRPVPYYKDLCIVCKEANTDEKDSISDNHSNPEGEFLSVSAASTAELDLKRQLENNENSVNLKKARVDEESMVSALHEMATAVSCLVEKRKGEEDNQNSIDVGNVIEAIQALPDMDDDLILDACDYLEDDKKAKTFLALDVKLRKKWLIRKLRTQHSCLT